MTKKITQREMSKRIKEFEIKLIVAVRREGNPGKKGVERNGAVSLCSS